MGNPAEENNIGGWSDKELIDKILQSRCSSGFDRLVKRYWAIAYQLCFNWTKNSATAEDITQEAFIKLHKYLNTLKDRTKFAGWFYHLVIQLIQEHHRRYKNRGGGKFQQLHAGLEGGGEDLEITDKLSVLNAMDSLGDDYRLVIILRFYRDMSCQEIAEHLGEPVGTITSRLSRAYKILKEKLR
ncbi:MAG: sigma-70 family RNA polymerase sigma factor [Planctomycetota bacterium]|nr:sigma-70 family RNA polymerase sigma factor [Planctomycetota bacterium]MDI6787766.1 sigma-70 family RNA polymerase sigma factor [Planctomycetota bacterium]